MTGLAYPTICSITIEVSEAIVNNLWQDNVEIDGCHIPIKCPGGCRVTNKEYHNVKNIYLIVLIAIVDAKYRFIWASCGYPGNSHNSLIFNVKLY